MARTPQRQQSKSDLSAFRGRQTTNVDDAGSDGLADDPTQQRGVIAAQTRGGEVEDGDAGGGEQRERKTAVQVGDDKRNAIFRKFNESRGAAVGDDDDDGEDQGNGLDGNADSLHRPDQPPAARVADADADGEGDAGDDDGSDEDKGYAEGTFELEVDGQKVNKSLEELEILSGLTADEIKAKPQLAIRFAQRELASQARLDRAKKIVRDTTARVRTGSEDADDDPGRSSAQNQGDKTGSQDDPGQQDGRRNTNGKVDFQKLVEDIQIGTPEEAAAKLKEALETVVESAVDSRTDQKLSEKEMVDAVRADGRATAQAMRDFVQAHEGEVKGKRYMAHAIAAGLIDEYRDDLRKAMLAEGTDADEVEDIVAKATPDQIAAAHQRRRIHGDPNVRQIDKGFIEAAYGRVTGELGSQQQQQQRQSLEATRKGRKEQLRTQPRRSSVPPANNGQQTAVDPTAMRKAAVADIRKSRGLKVR